MGIWVRIYSQYPMRIWVRIYSQYPIGIWVRKGPSPRGSGLKTKSDICPRRCGPINIPPYSIVVNSKQKQPFIGNVDISNRHVGAMVSALPLNLTISEAGQVKRIQILLISVRWPETHIQNG
jgi:hypothetical protein